MDRKPSPTPPTPHADPRYPPASTTESWTTHDSNLALLECLSVATPARPALPTELILQILDHPTRWVRLHSISHPPSAELNKPVVVVGNRPTGIPVLYTRFFSARDVGLLRKVVFKFRSRDQGWCREPWLGSWSWFEASLAHFPNTKEDGPGQDDDAAEWTGPYGWIGEWMERRDLRQENQPRYRIHTNELAPMEPKDYTIELTEEHELVQRVREGNGVILCLRAWENRVHEASICVLGMDDLRMD